MAHFSAIRRQEVSEFTMDRIIIIKLTKMVLVGNKILKSGFHCAATRSTGMEAGSAIRFEEERAPHNYCEDG